LTTPARYEAPTSQPTKLPTTNNPTTSPVTEQERCANRCFEPVPSNECPVNKAYVDCKFSFVGSICYTRDGECGTDPNLANCNGFATYRRVNCNEIEVYWAGVDGKTEAPSNSPTNKPTMLFITGNATYTNSGSNDLSCKYYPGWVMGLYYCVNECTSLQVWTFAVMLISSGPRDAYELPPKLPPNRTFYRRK
jgi:hypothetical protein